jgi:hypothetical protein
VAARLEQIIAMGFNYFMVSAAFPGVPQSFRRSQYKRFAEEVMPRFAGRTTRFEPSEPQRASA